jgi:hypothetical protein
MFNDISWPTRDLLHLWFVVLDGRIYKNNTVAERNKISSMVSDQ